MNKTLTNIIEFIKSSIRDEYNSFISQRLFSFIAKSAIRKVTIDGIINYEEIKINASQLNNKSINKPQNYIAIDNARINNNNLAILSIKKIKEIYKTFNIENLNENIICPNFNKNKLHILKNLKNEDIITIKYLASFDEAPNNEILELIKLKALEITYYFYNPKNAINIKIKYDNKINQFRNFNKTVSEKRTGYFF